MSGSTVPPPLPAPLGWRVDVEGGPWWWRATLRGGYVQYEPATWFGRRASIERRARRLLARTYASSITFRVEAGG